MRNIILLWDWVSEEHSTDKNTSLNISNTINLDKLTNVHSWSYIPYCFNHTDHVETYFIFPNFFWIDPQKNPWRAWLELLEYWYDIKKLKSFCIIRILKKDFDPKLWWMQINTKHWTDKTNTIINKTQKWVDGLIVEKSKYSKSVYCIWAKTSNIREKFIHSLQYYCWQEWLNCFPSLVQNGIFDIKAKNKNSKIFWYAIWPLLTALKSSGIQDEQNIETKWSLFSFDIQRQDFEERILPSILESNRWSSIMYFKWPSKAARLWNKTLKKESIEFINEIMWKLLKNLNENDKITFLTDHQSNIWEEHSYNKPTIYWYGRVNEIRNSIPLKFNEENIRQQNSITQKELKLRIQQFRNS